MKINDLFSSVKLSTKIILIVLWGLALELLLSSVEAWPTLVLIAGATFGFVAGLMQVKTIKASLQSATTLPDTAASRKQLFLFILFSSVILAILSFLTTSSTSQSLLMGCLAFLFTREMVTLKPVIEFSKKNS